jgi:hypothetical protein
LVRRPLIGLLYQPRMIDDGDCGAVGGMRIGRGNRSTGRKPAPVPLCPPQIPHDLGSNPGRRGGKLATNRLSYGTAVDNTNKMVAPTCEVRKSLVKFNAIKLLVIIN